MEENYYNFRSGTPLFLDFKETKVNESTFYKSLMFIKFQKVQSEISSIWDMFNLAFFLITSGILLSEEKKKIQPLPEGFERVAVFQYQAFRFGVVLLLGARLIKNIT